VFTTTYSAAYKLYEKVLVQVGGGVVPVAITYTKDKDGNYVLEEYRPARDGSEFVPSIREFCTMPVSGQVIPGLAERILDHYGNYEVLRARHRENLIEHLRAHRQTGVELQTHSGEMIPLT
jgi:hypothetical protein